jgi:hypothetical protein
LDRVCQRVEVRRLGFEMDLEDSAPLGVGSWWRRHFRKEFHRGRSHWRRPLGRRDSGRIGGTGWMFAFVPAFAIASQGDRKQGKENEAQAQGLSRRF